MSVATNKFHIGPLIRQIRLARGWGLNEFAVHLGVNESNLSRFERGMKGALLMPNCLHPIAEALKTSAAALFILQEVVGQDPQKWAPEVADPAYLRSLLDQINTGIARIHSELKATVHY